MRPPSDERAPSSQPSLSQPSRSQPSRLLTLALVWVFVVIGAFTWIRVVGSSSFSAAVKATAK